MTTINIKSAPPRDNWAFLYGFFGFSLLTLALALNMFALPGPYKIGIFYLGFLATTPSLLHASSRRALTLGWQKTQKGALRLLALL